MEEVWQRVLEGAWNAYCAGTLPIGATVVDETGAVVANGRNRRHEATAPARQLAGSRIAHAEINALAALPTDGDYRAYSLYSNVEPCSMCMGAALQTGVRAVHFAWPDAYAGAADMTVANIQVQRRPLAVDGPGPRDVRVLTAALIACHYLLVRPDHQDVATTWLERDAAFFERVQRADIDSFVAQAAGDAAPAEDVLRELAQRLAP